MCFSASVAYMPAVLIFPRKRMQQEFQLGLPAGVWAEVYETGWITNSLFCIWFKKFIEFSGARKVSPVLLLLDGHGSHTKSLELINMARDNGVILLCFPPHCTHRLQHLDVAFMKPFSLYYEEAYVNAANMRTAVSGFRRTGIWSLNRRVFTEPDFLPAATSNIELPSTSRNSRNDKSPDSLAFLVRAQQTFRTG